MEDARDDMHGEAGSKARGTREEIHWGACWVAQCGRHERKGTHTKCVDNGRANER